MTAAPVVFRNAELGGRQCVDVLVRHGVITEIGTGLRAAADRQIDCGGGALLPGLKDHHVHLLAAAAAAESVQCGPPRVRAREDLRRVLESAATQGGWIRGVGFDEGAVGVLDRTVLDEFRADVPVRVQHRSGALWVVNTAAARVLDLDGEQVGGIERDAAGRVTGRLWRLDGWLREQLGPPAVPDLGALGRRLCSYGLTGVTDASPGLTPATVELLSGGALPQRVILLGDPDGCAPWKVVVADHDLPVPGQLQALIEGVRPRPVALHCVTRTALVVALAALQEAGTVAGDRIEHAAVCPPEVAAMLAGLRVPVVTQPSLVTLRGDDYLDRVEPEDQPFLWPFASLLGAGVGVGCSSDAPYGELDPWHAIVAARDRIALSGRVVAPGERVGAEAALAGFLTPWDDPGGAAQTVQIGARADLVLLDQPLAGALRDPAAGHVRLTMIGGTVVFEAEAAVPG